MLVKAPKKSFSTGRGKKKWGDKKNKERKGDENNKDKGQKAYAPCSYCKKLNHSEKFCWWRPDAYCNSCKQKGHIEKVCKNKNQPQQEQAQNAQAQAAENNRQQDEHLFMATCSSKKISSAQTWLLDSGCSHHMISDEGMFKSLDKSFYTRVRIGNGKYLEAFGKGDVVVQTPSGTKIISDVLFVPDITENLVSVGQLAELDYALLFKNRKCIIFDPAGRELMTLPMTDRAYYLSLESENALVNVEDSTHLWHKRLGHVSYQSLNYLQKNDMVKTLPVIETDQKVCEICQFGKQTRLPFPSSQAWRASKKLQLVHSNVCGPQPTL